MDNNYVRKSLELHLFFGRIMKEHALFLEAGFTPANSSFVKMAEFYKEAFETLLDRAVRMSEGVICSETMASGEFVTEFTLTAEMQTQHFTGIDIAASLTERELLLASGGASGASEAAGESGMPGRTGAQGASQSGRQLPEDADVQKLNLLARELLDGLISFKETVLENVLACKMFTANYPLLIEHILREARLYRQSVEMLEQTGNSAGQTAAETECFWNQIMMEHAQFIRGLLDPSENGLIAAAEGFAREYGTLLESCRGIRSNGDEGIAGRNHGVSGF